MKNTFISALIICVAFTSIVGRTADKPIVKLVNIPSNFYLTTDGGTVAYLMDASGQTDTDDVLKSGFRRFFCIQPNAQFFPYAFNLGGNASRSILERCGEVIIPIRSRTEWFVINNRDANRWEERDLLAVKIYHFSWNRLKDIDSNHRDLYDSLTLYRQGTFTRSFNRPQKIPGTDQLISELASVNDLRNAGFHVESISNDRHVEIDNLTSIEWNNAHNYSKRFRANNFNLPSPLSALASLFPSGEAKWSLPGKFEEKTHLWHTIATQSDHYSYFLGHWWTVNISRERKLVEQFDLIRSVSRGGKGGYEVDCDFRLYSFSTLDKGSSVSGSPLVFSINPMEGYTLIEVECVGRSGFSSRFWITRI